MEGYVQCVYLIDTLLRGKEVFADFIKLDEGVVLVGFLGVGTIVFSHGAWHNCPRYRHDA
jgi:hypothetical protein